MTAFTLDDKDQRFEVFCFDPTRGRRIIYGYSDNPRQIVEVIKTHPHFHTPQVRDRARAVPSKV